MTRIFTLLALMGIFFLKIAFAEPVPPEHQSHCEKWQKGRCVQGALSKLANRNFFSVFKIASETCDKVCQEGCPNCKHCGFCGFCAVYNDQACVGVPYFTDRESCGVAKTKNCCDLCHVQCKSDQGVCSAKGYCSGGTSETDLLSHCVEKTTKEECKACK
jgi:hypothetical protein